MGLGIPKERIAFLPKDDNFWGPAGKTGPCGPCTEMFYWASDEQVPEKYDPDDERWVEIWNDVLMEYNKKEDGSYEKLSGKNVDTGLGVERVSAVMQGHDDIYKTELFEPIVGKIEEISGKKYEGNEKSMRVVADHLRAAVFILGDEIGVTPSNLDQGYVLRRLIRVAIRHGKKLGIEKNFCSEIGAVIVENYKNRYIILNDKKDFIVKELDLEEERFRSTLEKGLNRLSKFVESGKKISGEDAFLFFQSFGFPLEMTEEIAGEKGVKVDVKGFKKEFEKHQEKSRTATEGRFKSGLADHSEETTKLHTAAHLLLTSLREVLGKEIMQRGSNITPERLRFDFNFERKLTKEEIEKAENLVNEKIKEGIPVERMEMSVDEANKMGAKGAFAHKYGDKVFVYKIGDFSIEICAGPHVENTSELGHFKIKKEGSSSAGVRRIKAVLE